MFAPARKLLAAVGLALLGTGNAWAWGIEGHRLVAEISQQFLEPAAARQVKALLRTESRFGVPGCPVQTLADASVWPDCVKSQERYQHTRTWHFDDMPVCAAAPGERHCPDGDCLSVQTERLIGVLKNRNAPTRARLEALKFIVHLIGDLHQPLHAADNNDRGGNDIHVSFLGGDRLNLHRVWDVEMVQRFVSDRGDEARVLARQITPDEIAQWSKGSVRDWVAESHRVAIEVAYGKLPAVPACNTPPEQVVTIGEDYFFAAKPVMALQFKRAGVRLATVLNGALK